MEKLITFFCIAAVASGACGEINDSDNGSNGCGIPDGSYMGVEGSAELRDCHLVGQVIKMPNGSRCRNKSARFEAEVSDEGKFEAKIDGGSLRGTVTKEEIRGGGSGASAFLCGTTVVVTTFLVSIIASRQ